MSSSAPRQRREPGETGAEMASHTWNGTRDPVADAVAPLPIASAASLRAGQGPLSLGSLPGDVLNIVPGVGPRPVSALTLLACCSSPTDSTVTLLIYRQPSKGWPGQPGRPARDGVPGGAWFNGANCSSAGIPSNRPSRPVVLWAW